MSQWDCLHLMSPASCSSGDIFQPPAVKVRPMSFLTSFITKYNYKDKKAKQNKTLR